VERGGIFVNEIDVEHCGVVRRESDENAVAKKFWKRMMREIGIGGIELDIESVGAEIARGTEFERNLAFSESVHQCGASNGGDAVPDAFGTENFDGVEDLFGSARFSRVGDEM